VTAVDRRNAGAADVFHGGWSTRSWTAGTKGADEHTARESIDLRSLPLQTKRTAVLLYRLSRGTALP
jgi:hypothetical protein